MTRVCLVTGEYPPDEGGVADYTRCLADALAAKGVFVDVLTTRRTEPTGAPPARLSSAGGVAVHGVVPSWRWPVLMQLHRAVRTLAPDIVHIQYQTAAFGMHPAINTVPRWLRQFTTVKTAVTSQRTITSGRPARLRAPLFASWSVMATSCMPRPLATS